MSNNTTDRGKNRINIHLARCSVDVSIDVEGRPGYNYVDVKQLLENL